MSQAGSNNSSGGGGSGDVTAASDLQNNYVVLGDGGAKGVKTVANIFFDVASGNSMVVTGAFDGNVGAQFDNTSAGTHAGSVLSLSTPATSVDGDLGLFLNNNVTQWSNGLDNDDADAWVLSQNPLLGIKNVIRASINGEMTLPLQPSFLAVKSSSSVNATGDGTVVSPVIFDTEIYDLNADYNAGTGVFTAPVSGRYLFTSTIYFNNIIAGHTTGIMQLVTSNRTYFSANNNPFVVAAGGATLYSCSQIADMDAGDTASIAFLVSGGTQTITLFGDGSPLTSFSGELLG